MIKDWTKKNNEIIPPDYCLELTQESKDWIHDLIKSGQIFEQTGDLTFFQEEIAIGIGRGYIRNPFIVNSDIEIDTNLPRKLTKDGESDKRNIIGRIRSAFLIRERTAIIVGVLAIMGGLFIAWGVSIAIVVKILMGY